MQIRWDGKKMRNKIEKRSVGGGLFFFVILLLAACQPATIEMTPQRIVVTLTPEPPTRTPTATKVPTNTPTSTFTSTPTPTRTNTPSPYSGLNKIAFTSDRDGDNHIFVINSDGSNLMQLTNGDYDCCPTWSPGGNKIAFLTVHSDGIVLDVSIMDADGGNQTLLTNSGAVKYYLNWSLDGTRIAYLYRRGGYELIKEIKIDGPVITSMTEDARYYEGSIAWSPDGNKVVVGKIDKNNRYYLAVVDIINDKTIPLTYYLDNNHSHQAWSPDGNNIAFVSSVRNSRDYYEIYKINSDGNNPIKLFGSKENIQELTWSPDGLNIAFSLGDRLGPRDIYVMNVDGSNLKNLTFDLEDDYYPVWSPDGSKIVFVSHRDGNNELYVIDTDGSNLTRLTYSPGSDTLPEWSP